MWSGVKILFVMIFVTSFFISFILGTSLVSSGCAVKVGWSDCYFVYCEGPLFNNVCGDYQDILYTGVYGPTGYLDLFWRVCSNEGNYCPDTPEAHGVGEHCYGNTEYMGSGICDRIDTRENIGPLVPKSYNGKPCQVNYDGTPTGGDTCYNYFALDPGGPGQWNSWGKWDDSQNGCAKCYPFNSPLEDAVYFCDAVTCGSGCKDDPSPFPRCESACGADPLCDDIIVGQTCTDGLGWCSDDPLCVCVDRIVCGDGTCNHPTETYSNCPQDCCDSDCTATYDSICHSACNGYNDCWADCDSNDDCNDGLWCTNDICQGDCTCSNPLNSNTCLIDGVCYNTGDTNPSNYCQECNPSQSTSSWSNKPTDVMCDSAFACSSPGDNGYGTGGSYRCQGYCDGYGYCDYAANCEDCNSYDRGYPDSTTNPSQCTEFNPSYTSANQMRDYSCSGGNCVCGLKFDSYIDEVSVNGIDSGDVIVNEDQNIQVEVQVKNIGIYTQGWWFVGIEFWIVDDYTRGSPWEGHRFDRVDSWYNGVDPKSSGCDVGDCGCYYSDPNGNGYFDSGETITVTCWAPADHWRPTTGNERIMFWVHERDPGQDAANNGCNGDSSSKTCGPADGGAGCSSGCPGGLWWDDALAKSFRSGIDEPIGGGPASVRVIVIVEREICDNNKDDDGDGLIDCLDWPECQGQTGPNGDECCSVESDCTNYGYDVGCGFCDVDKECDYHDYNQWCNLAFKCSDSIGGDNKYGILDHKRPSLGYCDGQGNCDWAITEGTACDLARGAGTEGTDLDICIDGQQPCQDTCSDGINNDGDFDTIGSPCTDGKDSNCGGTDITCDGNDDNCDGSFDEDYQTVGCGDTECDGLTSCVSGQVICSSWNSDCDTKVCCLCDGGTEDSPTENYDETQHGDCDPTYCPDDCDADLNENNPYTWDYAESTYVDNGCEGLNDCTENPCTYDHECHETCGAPCDEDNPDCPCPSDGCKDGDNDGKNDDWADYPEIGSENLGYGTCQADCTCDIGTDSGQVCEPTYSIDDSRCGLCDDGICDYSGGENYETCAVDCCNPDCTGCTSNGAPDSCGSDNTCHLECDGYCGVVDTQCDGVTYDSCVNEHADCNGCAYNHCGIDGNQCCQLSGETGDCGYQSVNNYCSAGQCDQTLGTCNDCGNYTCSNGACDYSTCSEGCGASCDEGSDCNYTGCQGSDCVCMDDCTCARCNFCYDGSGGDGSDDFMCGWMREGWNYGQANFDYEWYWFNCVGQFVGSNAKAILEIEDTNGGEYELCVISGGQEPDDCPDTSDTIICHPENDQFELKTPNNGNYWVLAHRKNTLGNPGFRIQLECQQAGPGPEEFCTDYDHGIVLLTAAKVEGYNSGLGEFEVFDTCVDEHLNEVFTSDRYLKERNCTDVKPEDTIIDCKSEYGDRYYCSAGKCYSGRSGCPILKVWNGEEFVAIEKLDIHAPEGIDTTILKEVSMKPIEDGKYKIILKEAPYLSLGDDGSNIDSVMLTTEDGEDCELISAVHNKKGDVLSAIAESDDVRVRTEPDEEIVLIYECSGNDFVLSVEGYNQMHPLLKLASGYIKTLIDVVKGLLDLSI